MSSATHARRAPQELASFVANHWETEPAVLPADGPIVSPLPPESFMPLLVEAFQAPADEVPRRLFLDWGIQREPEESLWPRDDDASFDAWLQRVSRQTGSTDVFVELVDLQVVDDFLWSWGVDTTRRLLPLTGLPVCGAEISVYGGLYGGKASFNVHRDAASILHFPMVRRHRIVTWPGPYGEANPDLGQSDDYSRHREHAVVLEAELGEGMYWPSSQWHVGERCGAGAAACLSLGMWFARREGVRALGAPRSFSWRPDDLQGTAEEMQAELRPERSELYALLRQVTGWGFEGRAGDPEHVEPPQDEHVVRRVAEVPIVALSAGEDELAVSAGGWSFELSDRPALRSLLQTLNANGAAHRVGALLEAHAGNGSGVSGDQLRGLLSRLAGMGALALEI